MDGKKRRHYSACGAWCKGGAGAYPLDAGQRDGDGIEGCVSAMRGPVALAGPFFPTSIDRKKVINRYIRTGESAIATRITAVAAAFV